MANSLLVSSPDASLANHCISVTFGNGLAIISLPLTLRHWNFNTWNQDRRTLHFLLAVAPEVRFIFVRAVECSYVYLLPVTIVIRTYATGDCFTTWTRSCDTASLGMWSSKESIEHSILTVSPAYQAGGRRGSSSHPLLKMGGSAPHKFSISISDRFPSEFGQRRKYGRRKNHHRRHRPCP